LAEEARLLEKEEVSSADADLFVEGLIFVFAEELLRTHFEYHVD